jgi:hypothetical protein
MVDRERRPFFLFLVFPLLFFRISFLFLCLQSDGRFVSQNEIGCKAPNGRTTGERRMMAFFWARMGFGKEGFSDHNSGR